jgi:hypothetical protein
VLAVGCAVPATRAADESPANESTAAEMRRVWWDTAEQIGKRGDWAECAAPLAATLDRHPDGNLAPRLGALLTSIQMSADHPPTDAFLDRQTDTKTLIAALPAVFAPLYPAAPPAPILRRRTATHLGGLRGQSHRDG